MLHFQNLLSVVLETDSLVLTKVQDRIWEIPRDIVMEVKKIVWPKADRNVIVIHTAREGNMPAGYFTNLVFFSRYT